MNIRVLLPMTLLPTLLRAQTPAPTPVGAAAASIAAESLARHARALAADSFQGRRTPSAALERTARYVAAEFARLGLTPAGDQVRRRDSTGQNYMLPEWGWATDTTWFQRYPLPGQRRIDYEAPQPTLTLATTLSHRGKPVLTDQVDLNGPVALAKTVALDLRTGARLATELMPRLGPATARHGTTLLAGTHTLASVQAAKLHDQLLICLLPPGGDSADQQRVLAHLTQTNDLVLVRADDSSAFARRQAASLASPPVLVDDYLSQAPGTPRTWAAEVRPEVVRPLLAAEGLNWAELVAAPTPTVHPLPFTRATLTVWVAPVDSAHPLVTAPNVVGFLRGTSNKRQQLTYVILSAPLDEEGSEDGTAAANSASSRVGGGARARARHAGLAGLLALAQAFSQPGARPRYSLLFLATSGHAGGRAAGPWGSRYFATQYAERAVAHLGLDHLGPSVRDSLWLAGLGDLDFALSPHWALRAHPELGLTVAEDGGTGELPADHAAFVQRGVPSLALRTEPAEGADDGDTVARSSEPSDMAAVARAVQAAFYVGRALAAPSGGRAGRPRDGGASCRAPPPERERRPTRSRARVLKWGSHCSTELRSGR